jgi:iron-sulfur cluster repair protein YtfE (RIC family)
MLFELGQLAGDPVEAPETVRLIRLVELFKDYLMIHCWAEDQFFYPVIRTVLPKAPPPFCIRYMDQLNEEHKTITASLDRLERQTRHHPPSPSWSDTYAELFHELQSHMRKEEEDLYPLSERLLGGKGLEQLSQTLEENRYKAPPTHVHAQVL